MKLVADRLGLGEQLVNDALRGRQPAVRPRRGSGATTAAGAAAATAPAAAAGATGSAIPFATARARRPARRADPPRAERARVPRATASRCPTRASGGSPRSTSTTTSPRPRRARPPPTCAAACARPTANLPAGDDDFARLIAELVVRSGALEATPAKLELEALQLDLHRLERHISSARVTGATGVTALAAERQKVLDEIRHRLM